MASFEMGGLFLTAGINSQILEEVRFEMFVIECVKRHLSGDWGNLCEEDKKENELSLKEGYRLLGSYKYKDEIKIWIITEADRSATTILFPEEY